MADFDPDSLLNRTAAAEASARSRISGLARNARHESGARRRCAVPQVRPRPAVSLE